jgi:hypothetical protein
MMAVETEHLGQLIDNVPCCRINDTSSAYVRTGGRGHLMQETVNRFRLQFERLGLALQIDIPPDPVIEASDHDDGARVRQLWSTTRPARGPQAGGSGDRGLQTADGPSASDRSWKRNIGGGSASSLRPVLRWRRRTGRGAGPGLAIAKRIVADHHGTLTISSSPGAGTSVDGLLALPSA